MYGGGGMNTGAAYMTRRGWDKEPSSVGESISFHGRSRKKMLVIVSLAILGFLLLAAVIIIILFATGVLTSSPVILPNSTASPIIGTGIPPQLIPRTYRCTFLIERQANNAYNEKNSNTFLTAFNMINDSLIGVVAQSTLAPRGATVRMDDMRNSGENLQVDFSLTLANPLDASIVANVLRSQINSLEARLGGNVVINADSIRVAG